MKWMQLVMAGIFTLGTALYCNSRAFHFLEMGRNTREESRDKTIPPERANRASILAEVYSTAAEMLILPAGFAAGIIHSVGFALAASRSSDARIRALEEELKQLRTLVSANRQQG